MNSSLRFLRLSISGGIGPEMLLFLSHSISMVFERLPKELGNFPWRLFPSNKSLVSLEQFESEDIKAQSPASSMLLPRSSTFKFGNDPNNGMSPLKLLLPSSSSWRLDALRREIGIGPSNLFPVRINPRILGSMKPMSGGNCPIR
ncbi:hypothetical protein PVAP13_4NG201488 [Panicum virgatum]|uniref:Uncharacterized protein n=1 Tax=Panicum virgatum TaxID=38727 RepID=A0A8T0TCK2_PANVG|nr:hypothetical protein PVAP13_4NG201488 [Panicum virgatum]